MTTSSEAVMGFEDETAELIQRLVRGPKHLDVVSLVGMPGIGKTTLAKRLYTHNDIVNRFDVCSWCTISQVYNKGKTLLELFGNLVPPKDKTGSNDEELADELRRHLLRKKYFIVIDDLWTAEVWDDLKRCFPDDHSCSRIILTTRQDRVASYTEVFSPPHHVRLFTGEESWCLLKKKVFGEESCAPQLEKIGMKIAQSCGGLPLAIILVAGVLAKLNKEEIRWEEVANGLSSCAAGDTKMFMDIIELSLRFLPSQLRRSFLYFGRFCADELLVRELIQLLVAEEYAVSNELKSAEDEAKGHIMELIDNNLVMVVQRSFFGEVKAIRMHDLLREFCFSKVALTSRSDDSTSGDQQCYFQMHCLLPERGSDSLRSGSRPGPHSAHLLLRDYILNRKLFFNHDFNYLSHDYFKSLRMLDLGCITLSSTSFIQALINLRYLALKGNFEADPSWLSDFKSLETVILRESHRLNLSHAIWGMVSLKHLEVTGKPAVIRCNVAEFETYPPLKKLRWLSFAHLPGGEEFQQFVSKVPNLVKLRCLVEEPQGDRRCIWLPGLESLNKLESLKVCFLKRSVRRFEANFPVNLKKLTLSSCQLPWSEISVIGNLENLEVLKLESNAFEGEQWDVKDEEFQNLKLLTFYNMNVPSWSFSDMSFPNLQHVIFRNSRLKTKIPRSFGDLLLLQMIELSWCKCSRRTINSAEEIKKAQIEDMGNHEFKLIIKSREEDEEELRLMWQVDLDLRNWKFHFCFLLLLFLIISNIFSSL